jgi:hypothetical protein
LEVYLKAAERGDMTDLLLELGEFGRILIFDGEGRPGRINREGGTVTRD